MRSKIQGCELELEHAKDELQNKKGELAVKNSKLADVEMEVKLLQLRKAILTTQKKDRTEDKITASRDYVRKKKFSACLRYNYYCMQQRLVSDLATTRELFKKKLMEFSRRYDLHGSGLKYREEENRQRIVILQDELILLETGLVILFAPPNKDGFNHFCRDC